MKNAYAVAVQNRFEALESEGKSKWDTMKEALVTSAKEIIPKKEKSLKSPWITDDILELMQKRHKIMKRDNNE